MLIRSALACALLGACVGGDGGFEPFAVTFDPCEPVRLAAVDPTAAEMASLEVASQMWTAVGIDGMTPTIAGSAAPRVGQQIDVYFEEAAPAFYGFYDPDLGDLYINRKLENDRGRAVTMAHELGHAFGLRHVDGRPSVMNSGNLETAPTAEDARALAELWGRCTDAPPPVVAVP